MRKFRVLWYEAKAARSLINPDRSAVRLVKQKPSRVATFHVDARTVDSARNQARDYVKKRLTPRQVLLSVNFTTRPNEIIIYTGEKQERHG